jgi:hypothetical protein
MRLVVGAVFAASLLAEEQAPAGIVRGKLESWAGTLAGGELRVQGGTGGILVCAYNDKTYIERERLRIAVSSLKPGSSLEMVTDRHAGRCYARTVHVIVGVPASELPSPHRPRLRPVRPSWQSIVPRGNLTFSGIVLRLNRESMLLRTRSEGRKTFLIRHDTGFVDRGRVVAADDLAVNTQVFVRAGRNFEGDLEAYLIAWGEILPAR